MPSYTDDDQFWDGAVVYHLVSERVRGSEMKVLGAADVMVENRMDCCPGSSWCGSLRVLPESQRRQIVIAGFVRFVEREGHVEVWEDGAGRTLALLVGEVARPRLR